MWLHSINIVSGYIQKLLFGLIHLIKHIFYQSSEEYWDLNTNLESTGPMAVLWLYAVLLSNWLSSFNKDSFKLPRIPHNVEKQFSLSCCKVIFSCQRRLKKIVMCVGSTP